jgi:hypothetical protein
MHTCQNCHRWYEPTGTCLHTDAPASPQDWCSDWAPLPDSLEARAEALQAQLDGLRTEITALRATMIAIATKITSEALRGVK